MSDWVSFEGVVEPLDWGKATYTILRLPDEAVAALGAAKRVEGEINEHWVNLALSRAPVVEGVFVWAGASLLDRTGIVPGEPLEVRLRPAPDDQVDTPEDVASALRAAEMTAVWDGLTAGKRRGMLYQIGTAKTAPTRAKRIDAMIQSLR
ncbi:hypothetical protein C0V75_01820 [Tabrizicola sp. TH137]|uniref:YdeI/OmpD-associated family protein n=1 Tax=Tabrizicola sp. TH137 TaxID=2067452 RepID=UPI000C7E479F|nr:YdeI/OmpD-associated family protein [Tabrizicola sp. TH137]PLL14207.1 hypothetical protein C0V75_01820 [Tabrizicola sp. TH137]